MSVRRLISTLTTAVCLALVSLTPAAAAPSGWHPSLTRLPYLTGVTSTAIKVTWADTLRNARGVVTYGQAPGCTGSSASAATLGPPITVGSVTEYTHTVTVAGLSPDTTYCYRIHDTPASVDLLGSIASPSFRTLPTSAGSFSFIVFGDWGNTESGFNPNQAALLGHMDDVADSSGALFALGTGDTGYPSGSQTNHGDLNQTGVNISGVFGPSYWAGPGMSLPHFPSSGNHGRSSTFFNIWPTPAAAGESGGTYGMVTYPSINGTNVQNGPATWYAFDVGTTRFYMLSSDWFDGNLGNAGGTLCRKQFPTRSCPAYEVDASQHWANDSPEFQWLAADLAAHPGGLKFAVFHYPLRSDVNTQPDNPYTNVDPRNPHSPSLESLLAQNGVVMAFNGHAHTYQRNIPPPGGLVSYVSGGGGGRPSTIAKSNQKYCSTTDAYGIGWSTSSGHGSVCNAANPGAGSPTSAAQVHHFLKVTVNGTTVTVTPINATGNTFDVKTYDFGPDGADPSSPEAVSLVFKKASGSLPKRVTATWGLASDNVGVVAYDLYRQGPGDPSPIHRATLHPAVTSFVDTEISSGTYSYSVRARDQAGNVSPATSLGSVNVP